MRTEVLGRTRLVPVGSTTFHHSPGEVLGAWPAAWVALVLATINQGQGCFSDFFLSHVGSKTQGVSKRHLMLVYDKAVEGGKCTAMNTTTMKSR